MSDDESLDRAERINERRSGRSRSSRERSRSDNSEQTDNTEQSNNSSESDNSDNTKQMDSTAQSSNSDNTPVREKKHVPMYLTEEKAEELDMFFEELSLQYRKEHGEPLQKNRDFYPALVEALTEGKDIETVLGLSDD